MKTSKITLIYLLSLWACPEGTSQVAGAPPAARRQFKSRRNLRGGRPHATRNLQEEIAFLQTEEDASSMSMPPMSMPPPILTQAAADDSGFNWIVERPNILTIVINSDPTDIPAITPFPTQSPTTDSLEQASAAISNNVGSGKPSSGNAENNANQQSANAKSAKRARRRAARRRYV